MLKCLVFCMLTLVFIGCDSVDRPDGTGQGNDIEVAKQTLELPGKRLGNNSFLEITVPLCLGIEPAIVPPISTFEWRVIEGAELPDSVRWILVNIDQFNDDWNQALDYVRETPDAPEWHPWVAYDPDSATSWTTPAVGFGSYVFAVHGWDVDYTAPQDFSWDRNARRVRVTQRSTGPLVTLTSDFMAPIVSNVISTPITVVDLPGGSPVTFCWAGDASGYCGVVTHYRYGWDIVDLEDESQWEVGFTPFGGGETCSATRVFFFGTHTFYLEMVDNSHFVTRIPVKINFSPSHVSLALDIRPGSCSNPVNPKSKGVLGLALVGSQGFDVSDIDMSTLELYDADMAETGVRPGQSRIRDVITAPNGQVDCDCPVQAPDGFDDLHLKFSMTEVAGLVKGSAMGDVVQLTLVGLFDDGTPFMASDCVRIVGIQSGDDEPPEISDLDTKIVDVINTYFINNQAYSEPVNINDAVPDTVPYGSWIWVAYAATPEAMDYCPNPFDDCIGFQKNFTWSSSLFPGIGETTPWQPVPPEDNDPFSTTDSTSLNIGPVEYTVRFRSADEFGVVDPTPAQLPIVGNFPPRLDDFGIEHYDGTLVRDGGSIVWDWWNPANYHGSVADTLDLSDPPNVWVVKEFFFLAKAYGSDHPKEVSTGGVKSWFYTFTRSDDPTIDQPFARSGRWVDVATLNTVCDTVKLKVRYSYTDDPGGLQAWEDLPDWVNRSYDFEIRGRDTGTTDTFDQFMFLNGAKTRINSYHTGMLGRETGKGMMSFNLTIVR